MCALDSMTRCASAASRSGNDAWMITRTAPDSMSGQTCSWTARAMRPFSSTERARKVEPGNGESTLQDRNRADRRAVAAELRDLDQPSIHREHVDVALQVVAADHVEHDVDAPIGCELLHDGDEILVTIVDAALRAQGLASGTLDVAPGCGEDAGAAGTRKLNRKGSDPARAAVDQDRLPRRKPTALEDVGPDRERHLRQRGRLCELEPGRYRQALRRWRGAVLRVATAGDERADPVAPRPPAARRRRPRPPSRPLRGPECRSTPGGGAYRPCRCMTSGRFTPAAATLMRSSCGPITGIGRSTGTRTSGPPGSRMTMAIMCCGPQGPERRAGDVAAESPNATRVVDRSSTTRASAIPRSETDDENARNRTGPRHPQPFGDQHRADHEIDAGKRQRRVPQFARGNAARSCVRSANSRCPRSTPPTVASIAMSTKSEIGDAVRPLLDDPARRPPPPGTDRSPPPRACATSPGPRSWAAVGAEGERHNQIGCRSEALRRALAQAALDVVMKDAGQIVAKRRQRDMVALQDARRHRRAAPTLRTDVRRWRIRRAARRRRTRRCARRRFRRSTARAPCTRGVPTRVPGVVTRGTSRAADIGVDQREAEVKDLQPAGCGPASRSRASDRGA